MRYALLFVENEQFEKDWEAKDEAERNEMLAQIGDWLEEHAETFVHHTKLASAAPRTPVKPTAARWS